MEDPQLLNNNDKNSNSEETDDIYGVLTTAAGRRISYSLVKPRDSPPNDNDNNTNHDNGNLTDGSTNENKAPLPATSPCTVAMMMFYPLSGCSILLKYLHRAKALEQYPCHVLCVDRPQCGDTDDTTDTTADVDFAVHRIDTHVEDCCTVLEQVLPHVNQVYLVGVCLGHVFAVGLARELLKRQRQHEQKQQQNHTPDQPQTNDNSHSKIIQVKGLTLVSPFVSTQCPHSWRIARLGSIVPSTVLYYSIEALLSIGSLVQNCFLSPAVLRKVVFPQEQDELQFTPDDFQEWFDAIQETYAKSKRSLNVESRFGIATSWQTNVCDAFAKESGCGLVVGLEDSQEKPSKQESCCGCGAVQVQNAIIDAQDPSHNNNVHNNNDNDNDNENDETSSIVQSNENNNNATTEKAGCPFPIRIHATPYDKVAPLASVEWIAKRCYNDCPIELHYNIGSHELMTFFGGPFRQPRLLHQIAKEWNLVPTQFYNNDNNNNNNSSDDEDDDEDDGDDGSTE